LQTSILELNLPSINTFTATAAAVHMGELPSSPGQGSAKAAQKKV